MQRRILLLYLAISAGGDDKISTIKGPPINTPIRAQRRVLTSTVYTTVYPTDDPPLAQPGDLASYGYGTPSDTDISAGTMPEYSWTPTGDIQPALSTTQTFPVPLSSVLPQSQPDLSIHTPWHSIVTLSASTDSTRQIISTAAVSPVAGSPTPLLPPPSTALPSTSSPTATTSNEAFSVSDLMMGTEGLPTTIPLAPASSAMVHCAGKSGGVRTDGGIDKGCGSIFEHIMFCFASNGPWDSPYDDARNEAYRKCVCMSSDTTPFTAYSALWKNFTGCAACVHSSVDFDIMPWMNLEARRLWNFCRSQEPSAFLFTLFLKNWYYRLTNYSNISDAPFVEAFGAGGEYGGEMAAMLQHYTGRPLVANILWAASAPPSGEHANVSPVRTTFVATIETQGVALTTPASRLVSWMPTKAGETWNVTAADVQESAAVDELLSSALCLGEHRHGCEINGAARGVAVGSPAWVWVFSLGFAVVIGGMAVLL